MKSQKCVRISEGKREYTKCEFLFTILLGVQNAHRYQ